MGKIRRNNEDNLHFNKTILSEENDGLEEILFKESSLSESRALLGVFDGMGGEADGQTASFIAAKVLEQKVQEIDCHSRSAERGYQFNE